MQGLWSSVWLDLGPRLLLGWALMCGTLTAAALHKYITTWVPESGTHLSLAGRFSLSSPASVSASAAIDPCQAPLGSGRSDEDLPHLLTLGWVWGLYLLFATPEILGYSLNWKANVEPYTQVPHPTSWELLSCKGEFPLEGWNTDDTSDSGFTHLKVQLPLEVFSHWSLLPPLHWPLGASLSTSKAPGPGCPPSSPSSNSTVATRLQCSGQALWKVFEEHHRTWHEPGLLEWQRRWSSALACIPLNETSLSPGFTLTWGT